MKNIYITLSLVLLTLTSCHKEVTDGSVSSDINVTDQKTLLKSMLSGRDTKWTEDELSIPQLEDGWNLITTPGELAFLLEFGSSNGAKYRLVNNIDVSSSELSDKFTGEIGIELFEDIEFDGNNNTLSGMNLPLAAGLFSILAGDSRIYNLNISDCSFGSQDNLSNLLGTGGLAGRVSGNLTVTKVIVSDCDVCAPCKVGGMAGAITDGNSIFDNCQVVNTNVKTIYFKGVSGWCGGFAGFVGRNEEKNTSLAVSLTADGCAVSGGTIQTHMESNTRYCGKFIGSVVGYNADETVILNGCTASPSSFTIGGAKGADFVSIFPDGVIGGHKYMNGKIYFDGLIYVKPWDGKTTKEPAILDNAYMVYTAEELAWFQDKTVTQKIRICDDINLGGHLFTPLKSASYIDGLKEDGTNCEIQYLKVKRTDCGKTDGAAFIRQATGTTIHKNLTFKLADIRAEHDPAQIETAGGNAYCATLCSNVSGTSYTIENVHAFDGKLYGVNKMGGLLGRVAAPATINKCDVSGYYIENYEVDAPEDFGFGITFYPQGEVGGMIGFIHSNVSVSDCNVYNTSIKATGQDDKSAVIFTIPGRHVGTVIGDIRAGTENVAYTITITNCSADNATTTLSKSLGRLDQFSGATFVGKCYNVPLEKSGTVTVDGKKVL